MQPQLQFDVIFDSLKSGDICIDCGANVGTITSQMAAKGAIVYAFEPNPHAFKVLKKIFEGNKNIHLYNKGVWDRNTKTKLYLHENSDNDENKVSMGNENFFGKKIESDFLNTKRKRGGNHDEGQANVQS